MFFLFIVNNPYIKNYGANIGNSCEKGLPNTENRLPKRILAVDFLDKGLREGVFYIIVRLNSVVLSLCVHHVICRSG